MISPEQFIESLRQRNIRFFAGVPDSLLKNLCAYLSARLPEKEHIIAANEGAAKAVPEKAPSMNSIILTVLNRFCMIEIIKVFVLFFII